jgi:hypothetical protein
VISPAALSRLLVQQLDPQQRPRSPPDQHRLREAWLRRQLTPQFGLDLGQKPAFRAAPVDLAANGPLLITRLSLVSRRSSRGGLIAFMARYSRIASDEASPILGRYFVML